MREEQAATFRHTVPLFWKRVQYENGTCTATDSFTIDNATWTFRNGAHYITYEDNGNPTDGMAIRTTLRISDDALTLIRHGAVRWNHSFRASQRTSSTMYVGGAVLAIETTTKELAVNLTGDSGEVILVYDMDLSGIAQTVKLWIRFGEHDGESTEKANT